jgi:hypothetical protein
MQTKSRRVESVKSPHVTRFLHDYVTNVVSVQGKFELIYAIIDSPYILAECML